MASTPMPVHDVHLDAVPGRGDGNGAGPGMLAGDPVRGHPHLLGEGGLPAFLDRPRDVAVLEDLGGGVLQPVGQ